MPHFTALVTLLAVALYFYTGILVARARVQYGVAVPATTGNPDFERTFRVQQNMLEWMPIFLPLLWLFAVYLSDWGAAALGLAWIAGRVLYIHGYAQAAERRHQGFFVQTLVIGALFLGVLGAVVWRMAHGG